MSVISLPNDTVSMTKLWQRSRITVLTQRCVVWKEGIMKRLDLKLATHYLFLTNSVIVIVRPSVRHRPK